DDGLARGGGDDHADGGGGCGEEPEAGADEEGRGLAEHGEADEDEGEDEDGAFSGGHDAGGGAFAVEDAGGVGVGADGPADSDGDHRECRDDEDGDLSSGELLHGDGSVVGREAQRWEALTWSAAICRFSVTNWWCWSGVHSVRSQVTASRITSAASCTASRAASMPGSRGQWRVRQRAMSPTVRVAGWPGMPVHGSGPGSWTTPTMCQTPAPGWQAVGCRASVRQEPRRQRAVGSAGAVGAAGVGAVLAVAGGRAGRVSVQVVSSSMR